VNSNSNISSRASGRADPIASVHPTVQRQGFSPPKGGIGIGIMDNPNSNFKSILKFKILISNEKKKKSISKK
jgi:hypothetical protein